MSFGLTHPPLPSANGEEDEYPYHHHPHPHLHPHLHRQQHCPQPALQPDAFQPPLDPPPPLITYDFHVPLNSLFPSQALPDFSPGSSSCRSSTSSSHSLFNPSPHHQLAAIPDHHLRSPTPRHPPYLPGPLDLGQSSKTLDRSTLLGCPSRDSRSGSVSSESNSNWQVPQTFDLPIDSFEFLGWAEDTHWELAKFGEERGHERSRSEGDILHGSRFAPGEQPFGLVGATTAEYAAASQAEMALPRSRNLSVEWPAESREPEHDHPPFDPSRSKFVLHTLPTERHHGLQPISSATAEGPVMASFALPPPNGHPARILAPQTSRQHHQPANAPTTRPSEFQISSSAAGPSKAKKTPKQGARTGNNGGRCRRLAPANRECPHCGAKFTRNDRLNYHIDSIHEHKEPKFKCDFPNCSRAFRQRSDLVRHSRHVHHKV